MIPPPAMTTSALSMPEHAPEIEDQLELCGVVVPSADDHHARRADARTLQSPAHGAAAGPTAASREVAQVWVGINPQHREVRVAPSLGGQGGNGSAMVSAQYGQKRGCRHLR